MMTSGDSDPGYHPSPCDIVWQTSERALCWDAGQKRHLYVPVNSDADPSNALSLERFLHEYELREHLDSHWALVSKDLVSEQGRTQLVVDYTGGEPLSGTLGQPMETGAFLRMAIALTSAIAGLHSRGIIHKDIKPSNILFDSLTQRAWLTGFGIASRLPRERQPPSAPEFIAGTLAYMAPEQTGRMNCSVDSRSDLYSLGVTFYEALTGELPFTAADPMEWVHCHIARTPASPRELLPHIPEAIAAVTMKLLAKAVEDRYQTAAGVERDLRRCFDGWETLGRIDAFPIGAEDIPDRLLLPEKLYGREAETATLLNAFDRVVGGGKPEMVLVSGYSGIGKSALVNELHKPLVPPRGLFASGKFDQYKRDIPYATLAQAFQSLVRPLLSKKEDELRYWRRMLEDALGPNGLLLNDLVPELKHIIGEQPPVPELPPQEAQRRFQMVFRRFISVFARPEHPLALFLDDLQWLDGATLDLIEDILLQSDLSNLLLIGAYRDNEVSSTHPLVRKLNAMQNAGAHLQHLVLAPLKCQDIGHLLADALHCDIQHAAPLAELIHEKTTGNPFFAIQFASELADEGHIRFDYNERCWAWNLRTIHAKGFTDNVVELMVGKLIRLPIETQQALQQFACMGNSAEFEMLSMVHQQPPSSLHAHLWEAVRAGLIFRSDDSYRFLHDRVQEAAYSLIPAEDRPAAHLKIGTLLMDLTEQSKLEEVIFDVVNQLNRGSNLLASPEERERVAAMNLIAGRRAKASTAYESALKYLNAGLALLEPDTWNRSYDLIFSIEYLLAECEVLTASMSLAEARLFRLTQRARTRHHDCLATRLRLTLYTTLDRCDRSVEVFLEWLSRNGTVWAFRPSRDDVMREYERIWELLGDRRIEELVDLPLITDPDVLDTIDVFTEIVTPSILFDENMSSLVVCRLVTLSLENGNCDGSCFAYVWLAMFAGPRFGNFVDGFRFGQLGYELVETRGLTRYQARTYMSVGAMLIPWKSHIANGRELVRRAFDAAYRIGDLTFAAYSWDQLITICLGVGDHLKLVQTEAENGLSFARRVQFGLVIELCGSQLGLIRTLRGETTELGHLDHDQYTEVETEQRLSGNQNLVFAEFYYWTRKLQARFLACDYASAAGAADRGQRIFWTSTAMFETADFTFYAGLAHAAAWNIAPPENREAHFSSLLMQHKQLQTWAEYSPETFENRAAIVGAEIARIEGRIAEAEALYELAARSSRKHGFIHNEAIANEVAARFYAARGLDRIAAMLIREARDCYVRWGADGKVRQLELANPHLIDDRPGDAATSTIVAPAGHLDLATVIRVSEAVSTEIILENLIDTLMRAAIEHAGAVRGLLIVPNGDNYKLAAEATTRNAAVDVVLHPDGAPLTDLPASVLRYVLLTKESVLLNDAPAENAFSSDEYIAAHHPRSILCLPILKQARLLGVLYLENSLTAHAFTPGRVAILKLLASEAASSMENARLYHELAEREGRIRRLVDANIIGIVISDVDGAIHEANDAFLRMIGYEREDLLSHRISWADMTPPDWRDRDQELLQELRSSGRLHPFEKEFYRKDGSRVPVLIGVANFEGGGGQGVAFVLDLTERNNAAADLRNLQSDLAHANRLATMGQLAASIAHEVNQPIGAARNNAHAALRFLASEPPNLAEVTEALECVVNDTYRASDIIQGIRGQILNAPPTRTAIALNEAILEVVALAREEIARNETILHLALAESLPPISADKVQIQQVILNLILNAIEAMADKDDRMRQLEIRTEITAEQTVVIAVEDSGPGIDSTARDRIFESFYTTKPNGVGIGLSVCRSIVEAHAGRLWVEGNSRKGTTMKFELPSSEPA